MPPYEEYFSKIRPCHFSTFLTLCKKSEKFLELFLRKLPCEPTNYYQQHRSYRTSLMPVQKIKRLYAIEKSTSCSDIRNKEMN